MEKLSIPNFNSKLNGVYFVHIASSPKMKITVDSLPKDFEIDNDGKTVKIQLIDLLKYQNVYDLPSVLTYLSHEKDAAEFGDWCIDENNVDRNEKMTAYIFKILPE